MVYKYNAMLFSLKKEENPVIAYHEWIFPGLMLKWNQPYHQKINIA